jgi:hypothetical protein
MNAVNGGAKLFHLRATRDMLSGQSRWRESWDAEIAEVDEIITDVMIALVETDDSFEWIRILAIECTVSVKSPLTIQKQRSHTKNS